MGVYRYIDSDFTDIELTRSGGVEIYADGDIIIELDAKVVERIYMIVKAANPEPERENTD